jgi:hypothetical protein
MHVVYEAENLIDANLVKGMLENQGIPAFVRGEFLTGAMGELPVSGLVAVLVPEIHATEASDMLVEWRGSTPDWSSAGFDPEPEPA